MQSFGEFSSIRSILAALLISGFVPSDDSANPSAEWIPTSPVVAQFVHCGRFPLALAVRLRRQRGPI